jgi:hypothetical protein
MFYEVHGLDHVGEGHPYEIAEYKHEAEFVVHDVGRGKDGRFIPEVIGNVNKMKGTYKDHRQGDEAVSHVLRAHE